MSVLACAGSILMPTGRHFDPVALLDLIGAERVTELSIVGDAFAKPILAALDAEPDRWDISSLWLIVSSGVIWSAETKQGLLRHNSRLVLVDTLGSSEAIGLARSTSTASQVSTTAGFSRGADTVVIADDGRLVEAGSGERGLVALRGRGPIGYYKDESKTAATFRIIDGQRWSVPGDYATVSADGSLQLLGRGSVCINSGGEKIFPEEVEQALVTHPGVADAVVVGVPDDRFGEMVVAVVEPSGTETPELSDLSEWARRSLAAYKAPRRLVIVDSVGRSPSGKVDYRRLRELAVESLSSTAPGEAVS
jgi:fatty-acyl-CoA synthase